MPFAAAAGRDSIFSGVALLQGGASLRALFREHFPGPRWLAAPVAWLAAQSFRALEPGRHVGQISPRPVLLINAEYDQLIPRRTAERLAAAARPPMRHIWLPHGHLSVDSMEMMRELADSTLSHFAFLRGPPRETADVGTPAPRPARPARPATRATRP